MKQAPVARKEPIEITTHNDTRIDEYYWMRDMERKDPKIIEHLHAENAFTQEQLKHTDALQEELFQELRGRIKEQDMSVPYFHDGYYFYTRFEEGKEYPFYCRKLGSLEAEEEVYLNVNELAAEHSFYQIGGASFSTNKQLLAFGEDTLSRRIYTVRFKDVSTGEFLSDRLENTSGGCVWANDNQTVFYTQKEEGTLRSYKIFKHKLGTPQSEDIEVYHEKDATFNVGVSKSKSREWLMIHSGSTVSDEYQILRADTPDEAFEVFQPRQRDLEFGMAHYDGHFYILTNLEAKNFRLMKAPESARSTSGWKELIPHRADTLLEDVDVFEGHLVLTEKANAQVRLRIIHWESGDDHYIDFDESVYSAYTGINPEFSTDKLRLGYQSMTTPSSVIEYDMNAKSRTVLKQQEVLGGFDKDDYTAERLWATARDGVKVPMSLVRHKDTELTADTPLLLYGYGSYGHTIDPYFSPSRLSLMNRGFVFVIAHIRGSQMMGRHWYEDGKMLNKKNTFFDFIDCAEHLISLNYTSPAHLYAMGGSAGGLLMGAIMNERPDLWNGVIAAVPFVDVVTTMLDESIPLTTGEFDEWGNPKDEPYYHYIKSYSPYDQVGEKEYPNLLVTTGLHDSQVQYWEPAKWVARLRDKRTNNNALLFHINMEFGHSGASGRFEVYREIALEYAFLLDLETNQ